MQIQAKQGIHETNGFRVNSYNDSGVCPNCFQKLKVQKTIQRQMVTIRYGDIIAHEKVFWCSNGCKNPDGTFVTKRSSELKHLVPHRSIFGYDIEVYVGIQKFLHFRQRNEIVTLLKDEYGITISSGEISYLTSRFLYHFTLLHLENVEKLRNAMVQDGGYPLHVDATVEQGKGTLLIAYSGWRKWVLGAWKVPSERSDLIIPCLKKIRALFGQPVAIVRDFGKAIIKASSEFVKEEKSGIPILGCHLHFLADIGKDLMNEKHEQLRKLLHPVCPKLRKFFRNLSMNEEKTLPDKASIKEFLTSLVKPIPSDNMGTQVIRLFVEWILDYRCENNYLKFPFVRPYTFLYARCEKIYAKISYFIKIGTEDRMIIRKLKTLLSILHEYLSNSKIKLLFEEITELGKIFDELRNKLRDEINFYNKENNDVNLMTTTSVEEIKKLQQSFDSYKANLLNKEDDISETKAEAHRTIAEHIDRHEANLWGHLIEVDIGGEKMWKFVERTNNLVENFFRHLKHVERRRSGRKFLTCDLKSYPASAALVSNLNNVDYIEIVCGSLNMLPEIFSRMDSNFRSDEARKLIMHDPLRAIKKELLEIKSNPLEKNIIKSKEMNDFINTNNDTE